MSIRTTHLVALLTLSLSAPAADLTLSINAGAHDRQAAITSILLPPGTARGPWSLVTADGTKLAVQVDDRGRAYLAIPVLAAGQRLEGKLQGVASDAPMVTLKRQGDALDFTANGKAIARYQGGPGELPAGLGEELRRGGYLINVCTAGGALVTEDYPTKHKHHHGVWTAWTKTVFDGRHPDFWNMGTKGAGVQAVAIDATWDGVLCAGVRARHHFLDLSAPDGKPVEVLHETYEAVIHAPRPGSPVLIDLTITHTCATDQPLFLPDYHYGGIGLRGNAAWDGVDNCRYLTSEGKTRKDGNESRGRWCWMGGELPGGTAGMVILDHPQNFRHPQPMRLHPDEPFFCYAASRLGDWAIEPGKPLTMRYRIVAWDGAPDAAVFNRLWTDFAEPAVVSVVTAVAKP